MDAFLRSSCRTSSTSTSSTGWRSSPSGLCAAGVRPRPPSSASRVPCAAGAVWPRARRARVVRDVPDLRRAPSRVYGRRAEEIRIISLVLSFLLLLDLWHTAAARRREQPPHQLWQVAAMGGSGCWRSGSSPGAIRPISSSLSAADVLARYSLAIPGALLAAWALLRERRDFHARGMSAYGRALLWAALAFFIYGASARSSPGPAWSSRRRRSTRPSSSAPLASRFNCCAAWRLSAIAFTLGQRAARVRAGEPYAPGPRQQGAH